MRLSLTFRFTRCPPRSEICAVPITMGFVARSRVLADSASGTVIVAVTLQVSRFGQPHRKRERERGAAFASRGLACQSGEPMPEYWWRTPPLPPPPPPPPPPVCAGAVVNDRSFVLTVPDWFTIVIHA